MTGALDFAHPAHRKAQGLAAVKEHGSLRKAAAATGLPKTTLHRWATTEDGSAATPAPDVITDTTQPGLIEDGAQEIVPKVIPPVEEPAPVPLSDDGPVGWSDPLYLRAFHRYTSLLANGVHPAYAMPAAQQVFPGFMLDPDTDQRVQQTVGAMTFSEAHTLLFAADPPAYVGKIADNYSFGPDDIAALTDAMDTAKRDGYLGAINDMLGRAGRDPIDKITDQGILDSLHSQASDVAKGIADTWNQDVLNQAGAAWLDASSAARRGESRSAGSDFAAQRQEDMTAAMEQWAEGREDWKAAMWATTEVNGSYVEAQQAFIDQNAQLVERCRVTPDDCVCQGCQDLVDIGWMSPDDAAALDLPLHNGCAHGIETEMTQPDEGTDVWAAQADEAA